MQKNLIYFDRTFYESTSTEDDCNSVLSNFNSQSVNPRVNQSKSYHRSNNTRARRKLSRSKLPVENNATLHRSSSLLEQKNFKNKEEHQVTFTEKAKYSSGESASQSIIRTNWKLRKRSGTPRLVQAIRCHSGTLSVKCEGNSLSPRSLENTKSKCSVVVLCHSDQSNQPDHQLSSRLSRDHIRISKSEQTIVTAPLPPNRLATPPNLLDAQLSKKEGIAESVPPLSPPRRRQSHRRLTKTCTPLNVYTVQELRECQACKPNFENTTIKLMAQAPHDLTQIEGKTKRVFPFQPTPSGNLKIIPNQVVFESKKVSVLVADPKYTKVNVKAEITKPGMEFNNTKLDEEYSNIKQTPGILPPGVTSSTIDQLQAQQKLPQIETSYVPRIQPHRIKHRHTEVEHQQQPCNQQSTLHRLPSTNEVPLSSLGFNTEEPIDWDNINLPEKTDLYDELAHRITNYKNADFIVRIGIDEFHCHLLVLQSYSTYFDEKNGKEIDLTQSSVTSKAFSIIYDWMISTTSESCHLLRRDNILEIFMAAQYLGIKELEEQCWAFIDNDELFSEDTAFLLYLEAKKIENRAIMELMVPRIMKFFLLLVSTKDFLDLSVDELCLLLRSNYICVNSEMEILMSAVRWLMFDWDGRKQYMLPVLECVRFGLIAPWQLIDVKRNPENPEFMELMSFEEVRKMVDDGLAFVIIKYWYGDQTEDYYHWIDLLGLTEPTNRNWAGEDKNYVTYREFLLYLDEYQRTIMPELKLRRGKSMPSNHQQRSELQQSNTTDGNCNNHRIIETTSLDQVSVRNNNTTRIPTKFPNATVQSASIHASASTNPNLATPSAPMNMGMSPEFFTKYLTNLGSNSKTGACGSGIDNGRMKISNAPTYHDIWQNHKLNMPRGNCSNNNANEHTIADHNIRCNYQLEPNIVIAHGKHLHKEGSTLVQLGDHTDSTKSEDGAAIKIQASYRGYKTRRDLNKMKQTLSDENPSTKKINELFPILTTNDKLPKLLELARVGSMNGAANISDVGNSKKRYRPRSSYKQQSNSPRKQMSFNDYTYARKDLQNFYVKKFEQTCTQQNPNSNNISIEYNTSINDLNESKSIQTNNLTTLLYNFDGRLSSATPSNNNTDTEESLSPTAEENVPNKYKNFYRPKSNAEQHINIDRFKKADNYFPDYSLFHSECEAVLVLGGIDLHSEYGVSGNTGKDMYRYSPLENMWEFVGEIPEPRHHHSAIYLNGRIYLVGGADPREDELRGKSFVVGTVWSYDPARRQWFSEPEMLTPRQNFGLVVTQGKMFVIGGQDKNGFALKSVEVFDPLESKWRKIQPMNTPRAGAACANFQNFIWVTGGMRKSQILKEVECYDPVKNMWNTIEPLRIPRCFASLCVSSDRLYLIGGVGRLSTCDNMTESIETIDVWNAYLRTWHQLTEMSTARHKHSMGSIGNHLLIIGGITTVHMKTLKSIECFCSERSMWKKGVASLPYAISGHDSVSLPPSNILEQF